MRRDASWTACGWTPQPLFGAYDGLARWILNPSVMGFYLFWGFGRKVASQLGFDFLDGGQAAAQFLGEGFGELGLPGGDGDGLVQAAQGILGDELVLFDSLKSWAAMSESAGGMVRAKLFCALPVRRWSWLWI